MEGEVRIKTPFRFRIHGRLRVERFWVIGAESLKRMWLKKGYGGSNELRNKNPCPCNVKKKTFGE